MMKSSISDAHQNAGAYRQLVHSLSASQFWPQTRMVAWPMREQRIQF